MTHSVSLDDDVKQTIAGWRLSEHVHRELFRGFDELGRSPSRLLVRVGPPDDSLQYDLAISDPGPPGRDYLFVFSILYSVDEESLSVVKADYISSDHVG